MVFQMRKQKFRGLSGWPKAEVTCRKSQVAEGQPTLKLWPGVGVCFMFL